MSSRKNTTKPKRRSMEIKAECFFCKEKATPDFLQTDVLARFTSERGKIQARSRTGLCSKHQRKMTSEIKRARYMALLPFVARAE